MRVGETAAGGRAGNGPWSGVRREEEEEGGGGL